MLLRLPFLLVTIFFSHHWGYFCYGLRFSEGPLAKFLVNTMLVTKTLPHFRYVRICTAVSSVSVLKNSAYFLAPSILPVANIYFDLAHGLSNVFFLIVFGASWIKILLRFKKKM